MANNEEYLDSLLKSMDDTDKTNAEKDGDFMSPEEIEALFAVVDRITAEEEGVEYVPPVKAAPAPEEIPQSAEIPEEVPVMEGTPEEAFTMPEAVEESSSETEFVVPETVEEYSFEEAFAMPEKEESISEPEPEILDMPEVNIAEMFADIPNYEEEKAAPQFPEEATEIPADIFSEVSPEDVAALDDILAEVTENVQEEETAFSDFAENELMENAEEYTVESTQDMSEEEIESLLNASEQYAEESSVSEETEEISLEDLDNDDLLALLGSLDSKSALGNIDDFIEETGKTESFAGAAESDAEISGTKETAKEKKERKKREKQQKQAEKKAAKEEKKAKKKQSKQTAQSEEPTDNISQETTEEVSDAWDMLAEQSDITTESVAFEPEGADEREDFTEREKASKKKEKQKGGKASKLFAFLTEEDEEPASEENKAIMEELDAEDRAEAGKKKKVKKGKMPQKGKNGQEEAEGEESKKGDKAKGKKKKAPKPKKEKAPKSEQVEDARPSRRVSPKSVIVIIAFAATLFLIVFFAGSYFSARIQLNSAKKAFQKMDYATCYAEMYGMDLSEEEHKMFKHAELVLKVQRRIEVYEMYLEENKKLEAIDSLMQAVAGYEELYAEAMEYGAGPEVAALYDKILALLKDNYGLSQDEAHAIAACDSNAEYTRYLTALIQGGLGNNGVFVPEGEMQDVLPAEDELGKPEFAD